MKFDRTENFPPNIFGFSSLFSVVSDSFTTNENRIQGKLFPLVFERFCWIPSLDVRQLSRSIQTLTWGLRGDKSLGRTTMQWSLTSWFGWFISKTSALLSNSFNSRSVVGRRDWKERPLPTDLALLQLLLKEVTRESEARGGCGLLCARWVDAVPRWLAPKSVLR